MTREITNIPSSPLLFASNNEGIIVISAFFRVKLVVSLGRLTRSWYAYSSFSCYPCYMGCVPYGLTCTHITHFHLFRFLVVSFVSCRLRVNPDPSNPFTVNGLLASRGVPLPDRRFDLLKRARPDHDSSLFIPNPNPLRLCRFRAELMGRVRNYHP